MSQKGDAFGCFFTPRSYLVVAAERENMKQTLQNTGYTTVLSPTRRHIDRQIKGNLCFDRVKMRYWALL